MTAADSTARPATPPTAVEPVAGWRRSLRWTLWAVLGLSFLGTCLDVGLPTDRVVILGWVLAAMAVPVITEGRRRVGRLLVDWLPLGVLLLAYDATRGVADRLGIAVHVAAPAAADRWLGDGVLPTVWLQHHWRAGWWEAVASLVYGSHFVVTPVVLGILWLRDRHQWARYARRVLALSAAGLLTYVLYPAAPPWLAAKEHVVEPVTRLSGRGWARLGLPRAGALLREGQAEVNRVAAMPSLHTAFAVLVCLVLFPLARRVWQRLLLVGYAVLMPLVLVWAGEHYVIDTVIGALYAAAIVLAARWGPPLLRRIPWMP